MIWWQWAMFIGMFVLIWICGATVHAITEVKKTLDQTNYQLDLLRQAQVTESGVLYALEEWKRREEADKRRWEEEAEHRRAAGM